MWNYLEQLLKYLISCSQCNIFPEFYQVFKPFKLTPYNDLKVVIIGESPFPFKGYNTGLAFANPVKVGDNYSPVLKLLRDNIYKDFYEENYLDAPLGEPIDYQFDPTLELWARQGVLLLNASMTTEYRKFGSHKELWKPFLEELLRYLSNNKTGIIYLLIGKNACSLLPSINKFSNFVLLEEMSIEEAYIKGVNWHNNHFVEINNILKGLYDNEIEWTIGK